MANEPGLVRRVSYRELRQNVARVANVLLAHGVRKGDRVCVYMPMIPELAYAVLACARIGAVHSVVFAGVMFDGVPTWPDADRYWRIVDEVGATHLYTAPTALRTLMRFGDEPVRRHRRDTLRVLGTVGEPINPEVWRRYHDVVGEGRCAVVDTWWQTETGGILIAPLPGAVPAKPGSAKLPLPGVRPVLVDDEGRVLEGRG